MSEGKYTDADHAAFLRDLRAPGPPQKPIDMDLIRRPTKPTPKPVRQPDAVLDSDGEAPTATRARVGWEVIRDWMADHYRPGFKVGDAIFSGNQRREVRRHEACASLPPELIETLRKASDFPKDRKGVAKDAEAAPGFFKKWAGTAWHALLSGLPDEDSATPGLGAVEAAADQFRQLVREALLIPLQLPNDQLVGSGREAHYETRPQTRPVALWCKAFAKLGQWEDVRGRKLWTKTVESGGELQLLIALRHELFAQLKADRRLIEMGPKKFAKRAEKYGVGKPGGQGDRPHGCWAIILDTGFVADLVGTVDLEDVSDDAGREG